jgi:hypothetical protein
LHNEQGGITEETESVLDDLVRDRLQAFLPPLILDWFDIDFSYTLKWGSGKIKIKNIIHTCLMFHVAVQLLCRIVKKKTPDKDSVVPYKSSKKIKTMGYPEHIKDKIVNIHVLQKSEFFFF